MLRPLYGLTRDVEDAQKALHLLYALHELEEKQGYTCGLRIFPYIPSRCYIYPACTSVRTSLARRLSPTSRPCCP